MACTEIESIINKFESFTHKPANYLTVQSDIRDDIKNLVKSVYDYTKAEEKSDKKTKKAALPELIVQDFDEEQIWQEIELQNSECWDQLVWEVANCMSSKQDLVIPVEVGATPKADGDDEEDSVESDVDDLDETESEKPRKDVKNKTKKSKQKQFKDPDSDNENSESEAEVPTERVKSKNYVERNGKKSIVDDEFFKLSEMERFLVDEEKKEGKKTAPDSDEESLELFEEDDDDEGGDDMMYTDFFDGDQNQSNDQEEFREGEDEENDDDEMFDKNDDEEDDDHSDNIDDEEMEQELPQEKEKMKKDKKVTFADGSSDDESDADSEKEPAAVNGKPEKYEKKSEFELRQQRLQQTISRLENKTLSEAPWQLKGEVDATKRPQNSLLQEVVDFDLTTRPAPIITEQTTVTLEEIIRRRVKDKAWDDVVRKDKPVDDQLSFRKTEIIDQSKSKQSLAQVYEAEYLKQKQALSEDVEDEKEPESHTQIRDAMSKLFSKLDALCHYHYTPKAPQAEVKIVTNTPAISMEEVAPVATSDAALLAPEEVKKKRRGDLISKEERSQTDKNRERRKKKKLQKKKGGVTKVTDNRNTKKGVEASDKSLKTSKAFFQQLNDESSSLIKNKRNVKNKGQ